MKKILVILFYVTLCLLCGFISSRFQMGAIHNWYRHLIKPNLTPANYIFPIVWGVLYILMGISIGLIRTKKRKFQKRLSFLFAIQLIFNFCWNVIFFHFKNIAAALMVIAALDIVLVCYIILAFKTYKVSAWLFAPYLLWLIFATYLNLYIYLYN